MPLAEFHGEYRIFGRVVDFVLIVIVESSGFPIDNQLQGMIIEILGRFDIRRIVGEYQREDLPETIEVARQIGHAMSSSNTFPRCLGHPCCCHWFAATWQVPGAACYHGVPPDP